MWARANGHPMVLLRNYRDMCVLFTGKANPLARARAPSVMVQMAPAIMLLRKQPKLFQCR